MAKPKRKKLGDILIEAGVVSQQAVERVLADPSIRTRRIGERLIEAGICRDDHIAAALSCQLGLNRVELPVTVVEPEAVALVPEKLARRHAVMPLSVDESHIWVAFADPLDLGAAEDVEFATGRTVLAKVSTKQDIMWAIGKHYRMNESVDSIMSSLAEGNRRASFEVLRNPQEQATDNTEDPQKRGQAAPVIRMVNRIFAAAIQDRASCIHLEPTRDKFIIRTRVDGQLRQNLEMPKWIQGAVTSRIKIMAQMDTAEKRIPQDGIIRAWVSSMGIDLRVSSLPLNYGEKIVIRILDARNAPSSLEEIGLNGRDLEAMRAMVDKPQGIVLVTGSTESGKTTTLYAALREAKSETKNIVTIEDPIEHDISGINQVGIDEKEGRTYASVLPSILKQDPDVIMVGELRDLDTATIAMQASLTGQLVLSTVHTNGTIATIARLRNLGLSSYLIASAVTAILAQKLVRVICPQCKIEDSPSEDQLRAIGLTSDQLGELRFSRGKGCPKCGGTGYRGKTGLFELLILSPKLKESICNGASETILWQIAVAEGMKTLLRVGIEKVLEGVTTVEELIRATQVSEGLNAICSACGHMVEPGFLVCPKCGLRMTHICPSCSTIIDPEWNFCPYCASEIRPEVRSVASGSGGTVQVLRQP